MLYPNSNTSFNTENSAVYLREKYDNLINSEWISYIDSEYFDNSSPIDDKAFSTANILFFKPITPSSTLSLRYRW